MFWREYYHKHMKATMAHNTIKLNRAHKYDPDEGEIIVHFKYNPGSAATYMEPSEPGEINILSIEARQPMTISGAAIANGYDIADIITAEEFEDIETSLYEDWEDGGDDDQSDWLYELSREEE